MAPAFSARARWCRRTALVGLLPLVCTVGCPAFLSNDFKNDAPPGSGGAAPDGSLEQTNGTGGALAGNGGGAGALTTTGGTAGTGGSTGVFDAGPRGTGGAALLDADGAVCNPCGTLARCCPPHWSPVALPDASFAPREKAAYAAFGTSVFVWGGADGAGAELRTGGIYDAPGDTWSSVAVTSATPSARVLATAVWTGKSLVVWGGGDAASLTDYATGARYDPVLESWTAMSTLGAPSARRGVHAFWTGSRVLFWGGMNAALEPMGGGYLYDPAGDAWTPMSTTGEPPPAADPTVGWTGAQLLVYGGRPLGASLTGHTDGYDPALDTWKRDAAGPSARQGSLGAWDGAAFVAWGGTTTAQIRGDGQRYIPGTNTWVNMIAAGAPVARYALHGETGWSGKIADTTTILLGGYDKTQAALTDGGIYDSTTNTWMPVAPWPSSKAHLWGVGVWASTHFVLFGGRDAPLGALTNAGERFAP